MALGAAEVRTGFVVRVGFFDLRVDVSRSDADFVVVFGGVADFYLFDHAAVGVVIELAVLWRGTECNEDHALDQVGVVVGPAYDLGHVVDIGRVDRRADAAVQPAHFLDHAGVGQAQAQQVIFRFALPVGTFLLAVDVQGEAKGPGLLQFAQQWHVIGEAHTIRENQGLHAQLTDVGHDLHDVRVDQRLAACDGDVVAVAPFFEETDFLFDLFQRLVTGHVSPVAATAVNVAFIGDFQPPDWIIVQ